MGVLGKPLPIDWMSERLPQYERPPVVETAFAVEFAQLKGWNVVHYGILWEHFKERYPKFEVHPFIPTTGPAKFGLQDPPLRCFFLDEEGVQIVQVRPGAFVRNWRAMPQNNLYPRYATIRPSFERDYALFEQFLYEFQFAPIEAWKCEVTYINHFVQGREWDDLSSLGTLLPILSPERLTGLVSEFSNASFAFGYQLPEDAGSLQIEMLPVLSPEGKQILQLSLTAIGQPKGSDLASILEWFDIGRYAIVKSFSQFTSLEVQNQIWGLEWRT
ncbi:MAG: TIGR04255 family protein [Terracidiphilus sp.]